MPADFRQPTPIRTAHKSSDFALRVASQRSRGSSTSTVARSVDVNRLRRRAMAAGHRRGLHQPAEGIPGVGSLPAHRQKHQLIAKMTSAFSISIGVEAIGERMACRIVQNRSGPLGSKGLLPRPSSSAAVLLAQADPLPAALRSRIAWHLFGLLRKRPR